MLSFEIYFKTLIFVCNDWKVVAIDNDIDNDFFDRYGGYNLFKNCVRKSKQRSVF